MAKQNMLWLKARWWYVWGSRVLSIQSRQSQNKSVYTYLDEDANGFA